MATVPVKRVPPPPPIAVNDPTFNRWLHDLTAFIGSEGIDTSQIPGYDDMVAQVAQHTTAIASLNSQVATNMANIATHTSQIATHTSQIATHTSQINANTTNIATNTSNISTLFARSQVLFGTVAPTAGLGVNGDWYSDTTAKHIYVKTSGAWVLIV